MFTQKTSSEINLLLFNNDVTNLKTLDLQLEVSREQKISISEVDVQRCSVKKVFLKFYKMHRTTPVPESLF